MADMEVALSPAQIEALHLSPSLSSTSTFSCPSSPGSSSSSSSCSDCSSDCPNQHQSSSSPRSSSPSGCSSSGSDAIRGCSPPLDIISEDAVVLDLVIDPEVALKACHEVLQKVKLLKVEEEPELLEKCSQRRRLPKGTVYMEPCNTGLIKEEERHHSPQQITHTCLPSQQPCDTRSIKEEDEEEEEKRDPPRQITQTCPQSLQQNGDQSSAAAKQSLLLRLFESKLFDVSMAMSYLYKSKEPGVQAYIGNRLFSFSDEDVDFHLPQLLNMYVHMDEDMGDAIRPYVVHRCRQSIAFSLQTAWLLGAYSSDMHISTQRHSRGTKLRKLILSDELKPHSASKGVGPAGAADASPGLRDVAHIRHHQRHTVEPPPAPDSQIIPADAYLSPSKRTHQRSKSDATHCTSLGSSLRRTASNPKVESGYDEVSTFLTYFVIQILPSGAVDNHCSFYHNNCCSYVHYYCSTYYDNYNCSSNDNCNCSTNYINCSSYNNSYSHYIFRIYYDRDNFSSYDNNCWSYDHYNCSTYHDNYNCSSNDNRNCSTNYNNCSSYNNTYYDNYNCSSNDNCNCSTNYINCSSYNNWSSYDKYNHSYYSNNRSSYDNNCSSYAHYDCIIYYGSDICRSYETNCSSYDHCNSRTYHDN
ncbi:phosphatidylinositol 4-kinase beta-like [Coregonus clupeaformis]|uniref:phosphatidylinositol 4-kinase beta-like n=1 Tax=Coregonus clupeaformis TaxID=59861 RepID=UPI001E1C5985|nr:phosphatidylinositol 4-kinase beta-like [Coregonus clupeaformis]